MNTAKILCIDDDPFYGDLYRQILEPRGFGVTIMTNAADGYESALKDKPDLIILDVMMPEKGAFRDGYGLLRQLKRGPPLADVPVIMISALGGGEDVKQGLALGAAAYVPKQEMMPDRLLKEIADALKKK